MNIVILNGGLGNQIFQYAFGCYLTEKTNKPTRFFHNSKFFKKKSNHDKQNIDLMFIFKDIYVDKKYLSDNFIFFKYPILFKLFEKINKIDNKISIDK